MNAPTPTRRSPQSAANTSSELDPRMLWVTVRHSWPWALPIGLALAAVAAFAVYSQFVPIYRATHLLEANQDFVVFEGVIPAPRNLVATEKQLIYTDVVLDAVIGDREVLSALNIAAVDLAKEELRKNLVIGNAGTDSLLTIEFEHPNPETAALVCNKVTEAYLAQREMFDNERISNLESWLSPSIDTWKNEVQAHEKRVRELSKVALGFDPEKRVEGLENDLSVLSSLRRDLADLVVEESILEARVAMREAGEALGQEPTADVEVPEPTTAEIERLVDADPEVQRLRQLMVERQAMIRSMEDNGLKNLQKDYFRQLQDQVAKYESSIAAAEKEAQQRAPEILRRDWMEAAKRDQARMRSEAIASFTETKEEQKLALAELKAKRAIMQQEYDIEKARLEQKGGQTADLLFAQEDRAIASGILTQLNQRLAAIRTERRRGSGVHTLAAATPPSKPIEPMPTKKMIVAAGGAFAIPFLIGLLFEFRSQRICDAQSLENKPIAPIVGEVAKLPAKVGSGRRHRVFEESIDTLRANLMLAKETRGVRSITIASSMAGEGKSSVASQLAISLAKACGKTVLLIDADLRSPDQHDIFGLEMGPGLAKVMMGEAKFEDAVDRSLGDLVHVLPAGRMSLSPHRLLSASGMRDLVDQALEKYNYVIVDTAPVLAAGETLAVASVTDATLLCVMRDVSRTDTVVRSSRRLEAAGANLVGTVFSGVPSRQYAYRYGDYRYFNAQPTRERLQEEEV